MLTKKVVVVPYDERWKRDFLKIKAQLLTVLEKLIIGIDYGGSTSVQDWSAKLIIDIDIIIKEQGTKLHLEDLDGYIAYKNPLSRNFMQK